MAKVNLVRQAEIGQEKRARTRAQLVAAACTLFSTRPSASVTGDQSRVSEVERQTLGRQSRDADRQALFDQIRALYDADVTIKEIAQELSLGVRRVQRWVRLIELPARNVMAPKPCTPAYHGGYLAGALGRGCHRGEGAVAEINQRGYSGSHSHLARFLAPWRKAIPAITMMPANSLFPARD